MKMSFQAVLLGLVGSLLGMFAMGPMVSPSAYAAGDANEATCPNEAERGGYSRSLPDCRAFEMITPADGSDRDIYVPDAGARTTPVQRVEEGVPPTHALYSLHPFQVAPNGAEIAYAGDASPGGSGVEGQTFGAQFIASRAPGGWTTTDIQAPGNQDADYVAFSDSLESSIFVTAEPLLAALSAEAGYEIPYVRNSAGEVSALIDAKPPTRLPSAGSGEFGTANIPSGDVERTRFAGGNAGTAGVPAFSYLLVEANDTLTESAAPPNLLENELYVRHAGSLQQADILPAESGPNRSAAFGAGRALGFTYPNYSNVISDDGSRIFWTDLEDGRIYARVNGSETQPVSAGPAVYWTATKDGRYVYYVEGATTDSNGQQFGGTLWRRDLASGLVEEIAGAKGEADGVVAINETGTDNEYVYFVAGEALAPGAVAGAPNLYMQHDGANALVATLSGVDDNNLVISITFPTGDWSLSPAERTAEANPSGTSLVFMSDNSLTGYDSGGASEVFVYDAATGKVSCASCAANGAPLTVRPYENTDAAFLPPSTDPTRVFRWISADGKKVFFDTPEPLVASDTNSRQDVYEWEQPGAGTCQVATGCTSVISGGTSQDASALLGVSEGGDDVFVATRTQLIPDDHNEFMNLFDARVNGGEPSSQPSCPSVGCTRESSQTPVTLTEATETFEGFDEALPASSVAVDPASASVKAKRVKSNQLKVALRRCRHKRSRPRRLACERSARAADSRRPTRRKASQ